MADLDEAPPPRRSKRAKLNDDELIEPPAEAATEATTTAAVPNSEPLDQDQPASSTNAVAEETAVDKPPRRRSAPTRVSWEDRMAMLVEYKKEHGNLLIPIRYRSNPSLGKFVHNTREQYKLFHKRTPAGYKKKCSLTQERIDELDAIGFVWTTERSKRQHEDWEGRLEQLLAYKEQHGDCMVPHGYEADPSFAEWIHRQRTTYATHVKEGRKNPMVEERMKKLDGIGFNFRVHVDKWTDHYEQLKAYREKKGDCNVPTHYSENQKLGRWVHTQRHQRRLMLKGKKSSMTPERLAQLDALDFSWEVRPSLERPRATWQQRLEELKEFHARHGHFLVPPEQPQLHAWCAEQKQRLRNIDRNGKDVSKRMGPERIKALEEIGFTKDTELAPSLDDVKPPPVKEEAHVDEHEQALVSAAEQVAHEAVDQATEEQAAEVPKSLDAVEV